MLRNYRVLVASFLLAPAVLFAQNADPSGHWEGSVNVPDAPVKVEVDLGKTDKGELKGTLNNPVDNVRGLPLSEIAVDGRNVRFFLSAGQQSGTFIGVISADGKSITGHYDTAEGGYSIPFDLTRTGDAKFDAPPKNAPIAKDFEGTWNGTLEVGGVEKRLVLTMTNQPDSTSKGTLVNLDGAAIEIPLGITQQGTSLSLDVKMTGATYVGTLNADRTELAGTWTQGFLTLPLTFKRQRTP